MMLARAVLRKTSALISVRTCQNLVNLQLHSTAATNKLNNSSNNNKIPEKMLQRLNNPDQNENKGTEKKKIQAMPNSLTRLITDTRDGGWPSLTNIAILCSKCHQAGVDIDQLEDFLIRNFRSSSKKNKKGKNNTQGWESNFFSKHLLTKHNIDEEQINKYLTSYMEPNIYLKTDKINLPIKRAEYCVAIMRLASILGDMPTRTQENIQIVNDFIRERNISDDCLKTVITLASAKSQGYKVSSEDREVLLNFVCDKRIVCSHDRRGNMPSLLTLADCLQIIDSLCEMEGEELSPYDRTRLLIRYSQVCWDQANFSVSLETLQTVTECYLSSLNAGDPKAQDRLLSLSWDFVELWHNLSSIAASQDLRPAVEFLLVVADMVQKNWPGSGLGVLPSYILLLSVSKADTGAASLVREKLQQKISPRLRSEKFERCFLVDGMTQETKLFFSKDYLQRLLFDTKSTYPLPGVIPPTSAPSQQEIPHAGNTLKQEGGRKTEESPDMSDSLAIDMLDICVLELATERKSAEIVDAITVQHAKSGVLPSSAALETVIKTLEDSEDLYSLASLHRLIPAERIEKGDCYEAIARIKLRQLAIQWQEDKIRAWVGLVQLYRKIWTDQTSGDIHLHTAHSLLNKCQKYGKLFIEEATLSPNCSDLMKPLQLGCTKVATDFADLSLLAIYWEALFFSADIEHHRLSDLILDNVPVLVDKIDINMILERCQRYGNICP